MIVAVFVPLFGGYDTFSTYRLSVGYTGWIFTDNPSAYHQNTHQWNVIYIQKNETKWVSASRLSTKYVKFMACFEYAPNASVVIFHDANLKITKFPHPATVAGCSILWKDWPHEYDPTTPFWEKIFFGRRKIERRDRLEWEIENMLTRRFDYTSRSRDNVLEWREQLRREQRNHPAKYVESNFFVLYNRSASYSLMHWLYAKLHSIQRDQFLIPYGIENRSDMCISSDLFHTYGVVSGKHAKEHSYEN